MDMLTQIPPRYGMWVECDPGPRFMAGIRLPDDEINRLFEAPPGAHVRTARANSSPVDIDLLLFRFAGESITVCVPVNFHGDAEDGWVDGRAIRAIAEGRQEMLFLIVGKEGPVGEFTLDGAGPLFQQTSQLLAQSPRCTSDEWRAAFAQFMLRQTDPDALFDATPSGDEKASSRVLGISSIEDLLKHEQRLRDAGQGELVDALLEQHQHRQHQEMLKKMLRIEKPTRSRLPREG